MKKRNLVTGVIAVAMVSGLTTAITANPNGGNKGGQQEDNGFFNESRDIQVESNQNMNGAPQQGMMQGGPQQNTNGNTTVPTTGTMGEANGNMPMGGMNGQPGMNNEDQLEQFEDFVDNLEDLADQVEDETIEEELDELFDAYEDALEADDADAVKSAVDAILAKLAEAGVDTSSVMPTVGAPNEMGQMPGEMGEGRDFEEQKELGVEMLESIIDAVEDEDSKEALEALLETYEEALESEDEDAIKAAEDALMSALADYKPADGMPNGDMRNNERKDEAEEINVEHLETLISNLEDEDVAESLAALLETYEEALESEDEEAIASAEAALKSALDEAIEASKEATGFKEFEPKEHKDSREEEPTIKTDLAEKLIEEVEDETTKAELEALLEAYEEAVESEDEDAIAEAGEALQTALDEAGITLAQAQEDDEDVVRVSPVRRAMTSVINWFTSLFTNK